MKDKSYYYYEEGFGKPNPFLYVYNIIIINMKLKKAKSLLNELFEQYLERIEENTDENNDTDFETEEELMTDFFTYLESSFGDLR
jgi:hypothetical protein